MVSDESEVGRDVLLIGEMEDDLNWWMKLDELVMTVTVELDGLESGLMLLMGVETIDGMGGWSGRGRSRTEAVSVVVVLRL